jgi:hypothetical protein
MPVTTSPAFLRRALQLDAGATGATAVLLVVGGGLLAELLGLPTALLRGAGAVLVPFVGFVAWAALRPQAPAAAVWTIVAANAAWVVASIALLLSGWVAPSALGYAFVVAQAVVVGVFAELQIIGLRKAAAAPA